MLGYNMSSIASPYMNGMLARNYANASTMAEYSNGINNFDSFGQYNSLNSPLLSFTGGAGCYPGMGMGMMGMGYGPGAEVMNMSQADYARYQAKLQAIQMQSQEQLQNYQLQAQVRQQKAYNTAQFQSEASDNVLSVRIGALKHEIEENEQDHVSHSYAKLTNAIREKFKEAGYTNIPEAQVKAYANKLYLQTTGKLIEQDLEENGDSEFVHGLKEGFGCGLGSLFTKTKNYKDNIANVTDTETTTSDKAWRWAGRILAAGVTAGVVFLGGGKLVSKLFKGKAPKVAKEAVESATKAKTPVSAEKQEAINGVITSLQQNAARNA